MSTYASQPTGTDVKKSPHKTSQRALSPAVQYASQLFRNTLKIHTVTPGMSRRANCYVQSGIGPEDLMHALDRHAALAHCGGTAFH